MNEKSECINKEGLGSYIKKCLDDVHDGDTNWLGEEVYRRLNHGEEPTGQALATCHYQVKQWIGEVKGSHLPSIDVLFVLSGIFGKSVNEILAGQDLGEEQKPHLSLYNVARSNNVALYRQLCAEELGYATDEYDKSLLSYVLEFRSDKILLAMLDNPDQRIPLYEAYAVDPGTRKAISLGKFLPTAVKNEELFRKLYAPEIPWSLHLSKDIDKDLYIIGSDPEAIASLIKEKWGRNLLLKDYPQRGFEWIDKMNHCHVEGPFSDRPYLCGAFNAALEVSLQEGDTSFAEFGIAHNKAFIDYLATKKIPQKELKVDILGCVTDNGRFVATLAYLAPYLFEEFGKKKDLKAAIDALAATLEGFQPSNDTFVADV